MLQAILIITSFIWMYFLACSIKVDNPAQNASNKAVDRPTFRFKGKGSHITATRIGRTRRNKLGRFCR